MGACAPGDSCYKGRLPDTCDDFRAAAGKGANLECKTKRNASLFKDDMESSEDNAESYRKDGC